MARFVKFVQDVIVKYPWTVQASQAGLLMGTGDMIAQVFVEKKSWNEISIVRMGRFAVVGFAVVGPTLRSWYGILDKYVGKTSSSLNVIKKVALDQFLFAPVFIIIILVSISLIQATSMDQTVQHLKQDYPDVLVNNYKLWPAVQLFNFYVVPLEYRVLIVQLVAIFWNTYLSWKSNKHTSMTET